LPVLFFSDTDSSLITPLSYLLSQQQQQQQQQSNWGEYDSFSYLSVESQAARSDSRLPLSLYPILQSLLLQLCKWWWECGFHTGEWLKEDFTYRDPHGNGDWLEKEVGNHFRHDSSLEEYRGKLDCWEGPRGAPPPHPPKSLDSALFYFYTMAQEDTVTKLVEGLGGGQTLPDVHVIMASHFDSSKTRLEQTLRAMRSWAGVSR